jgi:hypothetical protein
VTCPGLSLDESRVDKAGFSPRNPPLDQDTTELLERIADLLAEYVPHVRRAAPTRGTLVDASTVADALGVSRDCVYAHAGELGGKRIGNGPRGRLRFDLDHALAAWTPCYAGNHSQGSNASTEAKSGAPPARARRRLPNRLPKPGSVLAVRPRKGA